MNPLALAIGFALIMALAPSSALAQPVQALAKIGFLSAGSASGWTERLQALREALRARGYIEGRNLSIEYRWAEGRNERLDELAAELVQRS